jgi:transcriptional regulator with XRE-family HTH domain
MNAEVAERVRRSLAAKAANVITPIDGALVRARRIDVGVSERVLAEALGVSTGVIDSLEHGGEQNHLTLDFIHQLATTLGVEVIDLLAERTYEVPDAPDDIDPGDPAEIGRHLSLAGRAHIDELARALGWTTARVRWALLTLEERLPDCGMTLAWIADTEVQLAPKAGQTATVGVVSRRDLRAYGLYETDAALVHQIIVDGPHNKPGVVNKVSLNRLRHAGVLTTDTIYNPRSRPPGGAKAEGIRLTDEARYNLCLGDASPARDEGTAGQVNHESSGAPGST